MSDNSKNKKSPIFYDFDPFKIPQSGLPITLFFENKTPVCVLRQNNYLLLTIKNCNIKIENNVRFSHDQIVLTDLFAKGLYYENITKYENLPNFFRTLHSARGKTQEYVQMFGRILRDAIDGKVGQIEILPDGSILSSPPEPLTKDEIDSI